MKCPPNTLCPDSPALIHLSVAALSPDSSEITTLPDFAIPCLLRIDGSHSSSALMLYMSLSFSESSNKHKTQTHLTWCDPTLPRATEWSPNKEEVAVWLFEALQHSLPAHSAVLLPLFVFYMCLCWIALCLPAFSLWCPELNGNFLKIIPTATRRNVIFCKSQYFKW